MDKKYKCESCGVEQESATVPSECKCGTKELSFIEITEKIIVIKKEEEKKDTVNPMDTVIKGMAEIHDAIKTQMGRSDNTEAEMKELKGRVEVALTDLVKKKDEIDKKAISRKGEFDDDYEARTMLAINKGKKTGEMTMDKLLTTKSASDIIQEFQSSSDDIYILSKLLQKHPRELRTYQDFIESPVHAIISKAMFDSAGSGGEWVPDIVSAQMIDIINLQLKVANIHDNISMPHSPYAFPGVTTHLKTYRRQASEKGADAPTKFKASTRTTRQLVFTAELLATRAVFDIEFDEESIIPVLQGLKKDIGYAQAAAIEAAIINGDTNASTGIDSGGKDLHGDAISLASPEASWDGYRKLAATINSGSQTAVTDLAGAFLTSGASLRSARANMKKYGINPNEMATVCSITGYLTHLMGLNDIQTLDKYGPNALVLSGELAKIYGIPIIISEYQRDDLNASGVSAGASSGNSDTAMQIVNRRAFVLGDRRKVTIESAKIQGTDSVEIWSTWRGDFQTRYATSEAVIHNIVQP